MRHTPLLPAAVLSGLLLLACSGDGNGTTEPIDEAPVVVSVSPALTASSGPVGLLQDFTVTFSEAMDSASFTQETVTVSPMSGELHLRYDDGERTLWVAPDSLYPPDADLTLSLSEGATDSGGKGLEPFSMDFSTGSAECAFLGDRFEPNDDVGSPTTLPVDTVVPALSTCLEDEDFFRVTLTEGAKLTARTTITYGDSTSWGIHWLREDGERYATLGTRAISGREARYSYSFLPGSYLVKIYGHDEEPMVLYDLLVESSAPCPDDEHEDNDFRDQAASVSPGTVEDLVGCHVDADWFTFPVAAGETITVTMDLGAYEGIRRLIVYEPGNGRAIESGSGTSPTLTLSATEDGPAFITTRLWEDEIPYRLIIDVTAP
jgi:hypothetical protein